MRFSCCDGFSKHQVCSWFHTNCVYVPIRAFELEREGSGCDTFLIAFPFLSREARHKSRVTAQRWPSCRQHCVYYLLCMRRPHEHALRVSPVSACGLAHTVIFWDELALQIRLVFDLRLLYFPNASKYQTQLGPRPLYGTNLQGLFIFLYLFINRHSKETKFHIYIRFIRKR